MRPLWKRPGRRLTPPLQEQMDLKANVLLQLHRDTQAHQSVIECWTRSTVCAVNVSTQPRAVPRPWAHAATAVVGSVTQGWSSSQDCSYKTCQQVSGQVGSRRRPHLAGTWAVSVWKIPKGDWGSAQGETLCRVLDPVVLSPRLPLLAPLQYLGVQANSGFKL